MKSVIARNVSIKTEILDQFLSKAKRASALKGEIIFAPGKVCSKLFFIENGMFRAYRLTDGNDYTHHFLAEGWFATDFQSYLNNQPGELYLQSVTDTVYYEFQKADVEDLYEEHHQLEKLGRIIAEKAYLKTVERLIDFQTNDLKSRYNNLIKTNPQLFNQIPQKYIASYLGVAEQSLSRVKADK